MKPLYADSGGASFRQQLGPLPEAVLAFYRRHPWTLEVPVSGLPAGPRQLPWFDRGLAALKDTRLTEDEKAAAILLVAIYTRAQPALTIELIRAAELPRKRGASRNLGLSS